jgi:hypothetical protein
LGWELPLDVFCTKGSYAQKVYFAKSRERSIAAINHVSSMLRSGPSNRTFVHGAAFMLAETSVSGTKCESAAVAQMRAFGFF